MLSGPNPYDYYKDSFPQNWHPRVTGPAPYNPFRIPRPYGDETFGPGNMGPNLPRGGGNLNRASGGGLLAIPVILPYIGAHLPIAPGDPGWTPPPSPSGPHNPSGDPDRPGYWRTLLQAADGYHAAALAPQQAASQPSYQQMINLLQSWRGGAS